MTPIPAEAPTTEEILGWGAGPTYRVASLLFPPTLRPHLVNVYAFGKFLDRLGDEAPGNRFAHLDWLSGELDAIYRGDQPEHVLMRRLGATVRQFELPRTPFDRLVQANRLDQTVLRYETFDQLRDYCSLATNPVGELVLRILGAATPRRLKLADAVCIGLQLVDVLRDVDDDAARGHIYVPLADMERFGYRPDELLAGVRDERFRALMRLTANRSRAMLREGMELASTLNGRTALAARVFVAVGLGSLSELERSGFKHSGRAAWVTTIPGVWDCLRAFA